MKKWVSILLVLMLVGSMSTVAFAEDTITESSGEATQNVMASYSEGNGEDDVVVSVDIAWEGLNFTYNEASHPIWNPDTHSYDDSDVREAGWAVSDGKVIITNHSNRFLSAGISYEQNSGYESADMVFSAKITNDILVGNADDGTGEEQSVTIKVVPKGTIPNNISDDTAIGSVTVTIRTIEDSVNDTAISIVFGTVQTYITGMEHYGLISDGTDKSYGELYVTQNAADALSDKLSEISYGDSSEEAIQALNVLIASLYDSYQIKQ